MTAVDALADDMIDLTAALTAEPSVRGNEKSALLVMEEAMLRLGHAPVRVPMDSKRLKSHPGFAPVPWEYNPGEQFNLVAVQGANGTGGRSCVLNGHLDVVSPEPSDAWETAPFEPVIRDGWMHGRGAGDMKAGVAAMTHALAAVERAGFGLRGEVLLETVIDEECSGNGALACLDAGFDADAVLIPEPFGPTVLTHQVGVMWFKVMVEGTPGHVLATEAGANAIECCHPLMEALRELERDMNEEPHPAAYAHHPHPLNLNIGIIAGGDWPSTVPARAEFHGRLSFYPGTPFETVRKRVQACIHARANRDDRLRTNPPRVEFYGFRSDGHSLSPDAPMLGVLDRCHADLVGSSPERYIATCTTDLRAFFSHGRGRGVCYGPVAENIHGINERVRLDSILATARTYALFLARWCKLAE